MTLAGKCRFPFDRLRCYIGHRKCVGYGCVERHVFGSLRKEEAVNGEFAQKK